MMHFLHSVDSLSLSNGGLPLAVSELSSAMAKTKNENQSSQISLIFRKCGSPSFQPEQVKLIPAIDSGQDWKNRLHTVQLENAITLIHQHGIWVRSSHTTSSFAFHNRIPLVVSPHGMLEPWALSHHAWRKQLALTLYQRRHLNHARAFHATCEAEAEHIRDLGFSQPIAVIANGVTPPVQSGDNENQAENREPGIDFGYDSDQFRTALFLSRLHPKKGIPMLLQAWAQLNPPEWKLVISGNDEENHLEELKKLAHQLNLSSAVTFQPPLFDGAKNRAFQQSDLFILPSHSENFGIVIAEALASGLPVITTRETPWQLLEEHNCGWWVEATPDALTGALDKALQLDPSDLDAMGQRGQKLIAEKFLWPGIAKQMFQFYHWLCEDTEKPDFVI